MKDAGEAIWLDANLADAYVERSRIRAARRELDQALEDANRAIELEPYATEPLEARMAIYLAQGEKKKADADRAAAANLRRDNATR